MKRLILLVLFILLLPFTVFAENTTSYEVKDYFTVSFPNSWKVIDHTNTPPLIDAQSPNRLSVIIIRACPNDFKSLDDQILLIQNHLKSDTRYIFQDQGKLEIDKKEAQWLLYSIEEPKLKKSYWLFYSVFGEQYRYFATILGFQDDFISDKKAIDQIISSMKLLK